MRLWPASVLRAGNRERRVSDGAPLPLPPDMSRGAADMQRRLEDARSRLKHTVPPRADEE
jgi:hypothetical protein